MSSPTKSLPKTPTLDTELDPSVRAAADRYMAACQSLEDASYWSVRMFVATNLFLKHLDIFDNETDPNPQFVEAFDQCANLLEHARDGGVCGRFFPNERVNVDETTFEDAVSGLFSDVWVSLTDDVYFEESYQFTRDRFSKSGIDPKAFFGGKTVLDAGCGSGKFSAAIARFGAARVIGMDIGEKGLEFARHQSRKADYGERLDYRYGSLLDIPLESGFVDVVWSNGVIHHTLGYERCIEEFARVLKPGGALYLYVNGRFGLFELLQDTLRRSNADLPRGLFQHYLLTLGINTGRVYFMMDCFFAPYEWKSAQEVKALLSRHGFGNFRQLTRGVAIDSIEQITTGAPYAVTKYGEGQLKFIAEKCN